MYNTLSQYVEVENLLSGVFGPLQGGVFRHTSTRKERLEMKECGDFYDSTVLYGGNMVMVAFLLCGMGLHVKPCERWRKRGKGERGDILGFAGADADADVALYCASSCNSFRRCLFVKTTIVLFCRSTDRTGCSAAREYSLWYMVRCGVQI